MTQIEFLHGASDRLQAIASWLSVAATTRRRVVVFAPQRTEREQLDRLLWSHPPTGFVPHCNAGDRLAQETPIVLAADLDAPAGDECLLNFSDEVPQGFSRFRQVVEIVSISDPDRSRGRDRYRFYRERGYPIAASEIAALI